MVFSSPSFDGHELVACTEDARSGLKAIVAVHNSQLGVALGGCRMYNYLDDQQALEDVLRLSRGMTYKSALAGLPMGGGKSVIIGDPNSQKSEALLHAMGDFIQSLGGKYVTAEDSGTSVEDMKIMGRRTEYVSGISEQQEYGGDPSPFTAYGVYCGIKSALAYKNGLSDFRDANLSGVKIAIQGVGSVGYYLLQEVLRDGAQVFAADVNQNNLERAESLGAQVVATEDIIAAQVDVFAPCAMGAVINNHTLATLNCSIVAGGANNQLQDIQLGDELAKRGILYAPDFVINAGGIIEVHHQRVGTVDKSKAHVENIAQTLMSIFERSQLEQISTPIIAEKMAESIFKA